jgi:hypothetical protein
VIDPRGEEKMKKRYVFGRLSKNERETLEQILLEEMEIQTWYAIAYCTSLGGEIMVAIQ